MIKYEPNIRSLPCFVRDVARWDVWTSFAKNSDHKLARQPVGGGGGHVGDRAARFVDREG